MCKLRFKIRQELSKLPDCPLVAGWYYINLIIGILSGTGQFSKHHNNANLFST